MKSVEAILKQGMEENQKELKQGLLELKSTKELQEKNKGFSFDISLFYDLDARLLLVEYTFTNNEHKIVVTFQMSDLTFRWNVTRISTALIEYAANYFNDKDFKINIGRYDGDYYAGIKEFMEDFYDEDEISNFRIIDKTFRKIIV